MAEYVPPEITGLPRDMGDFSKTDSSVTTDKDGFKTHLPAVPCVKLSDIEPYLPGASPPLTTDHCDAAYLKALEDIEKYAWRIESIPMKSSSHRSDCSWFLLNFLFP